MTHQDTKREHVRKVLQDVDALLSQRLVKTERLLDYVRRKAKQRRGRPALDMKRRRSVVITLRLTREQHDELKAHARAKGSTVSQFVRRILHRYTTRKNLET